MPCVRLLLQRDPCRFRIAAADPEHVLSKFKNSICLKYYTIQEHHATALSAVSHHTIIQRPQQQPAIGLHGVSSRVTQCGIVVKNSASLLVINSLLSRYIPAIHK
jgi:hypothetical protein